jgi:predicted nucleic acid-binding protein
MVVFDATMLMLLIRPESGVPLDSKTGKPVSNVQERIAHFVEQNDKAKTRIGLPTPALGEVLVRAGSDAIKILEKIKEFAVFEILPFDELSAIELAILTKNALDAGDKKSGSKDLWNKVKYDRQLIAIARVRQATAIYTDDHGLRNLATMLNIPATGIAEMPLPVEAAQGKLPFNATLPENVNEPSLEEIEEARDAEVTQPGTV